MVRGPGSRGDDEYSVWTVCVRVTADEEASTPPRIVADGDLLTKYGHLLVMLGPVSHPRRDMSMEFWPLIHAERAALIDDLEKLDEAQWATRSLCSEWSVREVVAHLSRDGEPL